MRFVNVSEGCEALEEDPRTFGVCPDAVCDFRGGPRAVPQGLEDAEVDGQADRAERARPDQVEEGVRAKVEPAEEEVLGRSSLGPARGGQPGGHPARDDHRRDARDDEGHALEDVEERMRLVWPTVTVDQEVVEVRDVEREPRRRAEQREGRRMSIERVGDHADE